MNNKRSVSIANGDRISNLPEHLIDSILEWIPIQDVIRTSILSKKWRYKWTTTRTMVFDEQISKKLAKHGAFGRHGFIRVINQILLLHKGSIKKFYLYIPDMFLDSFQEIDQWMLFLSTKGVEDLTLANSNQPYQLSFGVFSCLELRKLELKNCVFKPPLQFDGFLYLECLILESIDFMTDSSGSVIKLLQLRKLTIRSCTNVHNLKIKASKLQILLVLNCADLMLLDLLHSQHLASVCVTSVKSNKDSVRAKRMDLASMFSKMPNVKGFYVDGHFLKDSIAKKPKWFPHGVTCLKVLILFNISLGDMEHLHAVLCLLRNSPNLETLRMMYILTESELMQHEVETASNYLESADCLDQTLNRLQTVELSPLEGSRSQLLFIKLLLAHSPSLKKFTIQSKTNLDANKRFNIAKDIMRFPRASSKAELIYLDPTT